MSLVTVCGSSSMFFQVTVSPAWMVTAIGMNMKDLTLTVASSAKAAPDESAVATSPAIMAARSAREEHGIVMVISFKPKRACGRRARWRGRGGRP